MQNRLAHESGDPGVQFNEKTEVRKSRDTVPLNVVHNEINNKIPKIKLVLF
jgi:hypothetical protein